MNENILNVKPYKKDYDYSYTLGAFPSIDMIKSKPECVQMIYMHESFTEKEMLVKLCNEKGIKSTVDNRVINRLRDKDNIFIIGVFYKYFELIRSDQPHLVLVNPRDMGNLGNIIRTAVGFGIKDIAVIHPAADIFHPKTIRASMGAVFMLHHEYYDSFESYREAHVKHEVYTFMLNGEKCLTSDFRCKNNLYSLVFGNEASGLDDSYLNVGTSLRIPQNGEIDSLNLTVSAGIGMYAFTEFNKCLDK